MTFPGPTQEKLGLSVFEADYARLVTLTDVVQDVERRRH